MIMWRCVVDCSALFVQEENNVAKIIDFIKTHATHQPVIKGEKKMKKKAKDKKEEL